MTNLLSLTIGAPIANIGGFNRRCVAELFFLPATRSKRVRKSNHHGSNQTLLKLKQKDFSMDALLGLIIIAFAGLVLVGWFLFCNLVIASVALALATLLTWPLRNDTKRWSRPILAFSIAGLWVVPLAVLLPLSAYGIASICASTLLAAIMAFCID